MTLQMEELEGSPTIRLNRKEMIGTRIFKVDWADWPTFVELVWGVWQNVGSATTYIPASSFYGLPGMWASDIDIVPFQPDSPLGGPVSLGGIQVGYNWAKITVTYKPFPIPDGRYPNVPNGTFLVIDGNIGSEYMSVPGRHWQWPDNTTAEDDLTAGLLVPHESIQMSWRWVPQPPWTAMRTIRGCVNNAAFFGHAAGNVLFLGATYDREYQANSGAASLWRINYRFSCKEVVGTTSSAVYGHNYFFRGNAGAGNENWQKLTSKDNPGSPVFQAADFSQLFQFGS